MKLVLFFELKDSSSETIKIDVFDDIFKKKIVVENILEWMSLKIVWIDYLKIKNDLLLILFCKNDKNK